MPKSYTEVQAAYEAGNIMDWTNAINRLNGIPLDPTSIFNTYNDAIIYAATSPVAYVGQLVSVRGAVYVINPTPIETKDILGVTYDNYLVLLAKQKNLEMLVDRVEVLENSMDIIPSKSFIIIDGGNAETAEAEATTE